MGCDCTNAGIRTVKLNCHIQPLNPLKDSHVTMSHEIPQYTPRPSRQSNIEALRLVSIFLIVLSHCCVHTPWDIGASQAQKCILGSLSLGEVGVTCFVLISGYFLWNRPFRFSRLMRIIIQTLSYSIICYLIALYIDGSVDSNWRSIILPTLSGTYWFTSTYVGLMLIHPFINLILSSLTISSHRALLVFGFATLSAFPFFVGVQFVFSNLLYFIYLYILGAYFGRRGGLVKAGT